MQFAIFLKYFKMFGNFLGFCNLKSHLTSSSLIIGYRIASRCNKVFKDFNISNL